MGFERFAVPCSTSATSEVLDPNSSCNLQKWVLPVFGIAITTVAFVLLASRSGQQGRKLPPGPRNWPVIGSLLTMAPLLNDGLHKAFDKLAAQYGPIVYIRLGAQTVVLVSSAEAAEELLKHKDAAFANRDTTMTRMKAKYIGMDSAVFTFSNYDDFNLKLGRKIAMTEFFTGAKLKSYEELRREEIAVMVEKILLQIDSSAADLKRDHRNHPSVVAAASSTTVPIRQAAVAMVQNIIFTLTIGKRFDDIPVTDEIKEFPGLLEDHFKLLMNSYWMEFFPFLEWLTPQGILRDLKKFKKRQEAFFARIVERHRRLRKKPNSGSEILTEDDGSSLSNFVEVLLRFQEDGGKMSDKDLMGMVLTMLMASIHTISSQIEWVLVELVRHPNLLERLQTEIDGVVGKERAVQESDLQAMPLLNAVMLETFRLHPVVQVTPPHVNTRPVTLGGYYIPPDTAMITNIRCIGRCPKTWKYPLQFNPDRFMAIGLSEVDPALSSESRSVNGSNYHLLPFGSGRRMCPGYSLATVLLPRMVAALVHAMDLSPPPGSSAKDLSIEEGHSYILHPDPDLLLTCTPRLSRHVYKSNISY